LQISRMPRITKLDGELVVQAICSPGERPIVLLDGPIIRIRPIPASTEVIVDVNESIAGFRSATIVDTQGRSVLDAATSKTISLAGLADGVYTIIVTTTAGQWVSPLVIANN
jgi:hypothetical protein